MKINYFYFLFIIASAVFAQEQISFEESEGYVVGPIHDQLGWEAHPDEENDIANNQLIVVGDATNGSAMLKLNAEDSFSTSVPINTIYNLENALDSNDFVISFDVNINEQVSAYADRTANFYFSNSASPFNSSTVYQIQMINNGLIKIVSGITASGYPDYINADVTWTPGEWYRIKIEGNSDGVSYYINGEIVATLDPLNEGATMIDQIYFRHNNYGNSADDYGLIDNITINNENVLAVEDVSDARIDSYVYPNPTFDELYIKSNSKVKSVLISDMTGSVVNATNSDNKVDVRSLSKGIYIISIETEKGITTQKFIKK